MVVIALRCHDPAEDEARADLARRLGVVWEIPLLASTVAEAEWVAGRCTDPVLMLVTAPDHAERAVRTFAKAMPHTRIYVTTTSLERQKCVAYAGDLLTEGEYAAYLAWRDG